jgi:hypothetical protein
MPLRYGYGQFATTDDSDPHLHCVKVRHCRDGGDVIKEARLEAGKAYSVIHVEEGHGVPSLAWADESVPRRHVLNLKNEFSCIKNKVGALCATQDPGFPAKDRDLRDQKGTKNVYD